MPAMKSTRQGKPAINCGSGFSREKESLYPSRLKPLPQFHNNTIGNESKNIAGMARSYKPCPPDV